MLQRIWWHYGCWFVLLVLSCHSDIVSSIKLGLINGNSAFFEPVEQGFVGQCQHLGIEHAIADSTNETTTDCLQEHLTALDAFTQAGVNGIAMRPCDNATEATMVIAKATNAGTPVVTFDQDRIGVVSQGYRQEESIVPEEPPTLIVSFDQGTRASELAT